MSTYSHTPEDPGKAVKCKGTNIRVHFKNTRETAMAIKGRSLTNAQNYLNDVIAHKQAIPFRRFTGNIGRHAQGKQFKNHGSRQTRWPTKSCEALLNAASNAEAKGLDVAALKLVHVQVNQAPKMRRRTYRAHGRIGPYKRCPCHVELIFTEKNGDVAKPTDASDASLQIAQ